MYGLKRLLEIEAERKRKKEEKAKKKAEKEALKKQEQREKRKKRLRKKQNRRYYVKKRKAFMEEKNKIGDRKAYTMVILVKNKKRIEKFGSSWWISEGYKLYNDALKKNREEVKFPVKFRTSSDNSVRSQNRIDTKWELLLVENMNEEDNVSEFRDEDGRFVNVQIIDKKKYKIIARDVWNVEEQFNVYGYHPQKDRKDYTFILNELFLKKLEQIHDVIRVNVLSNKVIISHSEDFDFVVCKCNEEAKRLYSALQSDEHLSKNKNVIFFGEIKVKAQATEMYDKIQEKTGWDRSLCKRNTSL